MASESATLLPHPQSSPNVIVPRANGLTRKPDVPKVIYEFKGIERSFTDQLVCLLQVSLLALCILAGKARGVSLIQNPPCISFQRLMSVYSLIIRENV